jgi:hypothetical protein
MQGRALFAEIERLISEETGLAAITNAALAAALGISTPTLAKWREREEWTPRQIANLFAKKQKIALGQAAAQQVRCTVVPIVEFLFIDYVESQRGARWELFGDAHPYYAGLKQRLKARHGVYLFYDSRGRAIYAGKADQLSLWAEMNNAFNRDRGQVQRIKRVSHPERKQQYKGLEEVNRKISDHYVQLHEIASYISAYEVPKPLIGKIEALLVRGFANDLLNMRMETI